MWRIVRSVLDDAGLSLVADHREWASGVPDALELLGVQVQRTTLDAGDYLVAKQTRVERKTVRDLHSSVVSRRLWFQLNRMRAMCSYPVLLVEGPDIDAGPLPQSAIRGALVALGDRGIPVIRSTDRDDSARWLRSLAQSRVLGKRVQVVAPYRPRAGTRDPVPVAMLCAIPGISLRDARALMVRFRTIKAMTNASAEDLKTVAGIGETKATAVQVALTHVL